MSDTLFFSLRCHIVYHFRRNSLNIITVLILEIMENVTAISTSYVSTIEKKKKKSKERNFKKEKAALDSSPYWYLYQRNFHNALLTPEKASSSYQPPPLPPVSASSALNYHDDYLCTIIFSPINPFPFISFDLSNPATHRLPHKSEIKLTIIDYTRDEEIYSLFETTKKENLVKRNEAKGDIVSASNEEVNRPLIVEVLPKTKADEKEFNSKLLLPFFFVFSDFLSSFLPFFLSSFLPFFLSSFLPFFQVL
jgi:hypothetical protein